MSVSPASNRLDHLDATRAFALVLGIVFHASLSFMPVFMGWAVMDVSTSAWIPGFVMASHAFRLELFFLLAGFFGHAAFHRRGLAHFVRTRALRIGVPFVAGWFLLRPLLVSGWIMGSASLRGDYAFWPGVAAGFRSLGTLPAGLFTGSHLWFLYYLLLVTGLTLLVRQLLEAAGRRERLANRVDAIVAWLARSPWGLLALVIPTAAAVWCMRFWGMDTPDQSLRPHGPVLFVYGGFFAVGWLLHRRPAVLATWSTVTFKRIAAALLALVLCLQLGPLEREPSHPYHTAAHVAFVLGYGLMMWTLVFLTIGVFQRLCTRPRSWVRYVADASYWLYLIHLPLVVWLQVAFAEVPLSWAVKFPAIVLLTLGAGLVSYDLCIRSTWIGWILNGQRRPRALRLRRLAGDASAATNPASAG